MPVKIKLEPSPPKRLRPGVGYATDTGARFSLRYQDLNVFRRGHDFNADLSLAERRRALSALYAFPNPGHIENRTILKTGLQQEMLKPYDTWLFTAGSGTGPQLREGEGGLRLPPVPAGEFLRSRAGGKIQPDFAGSPFYPAAGGRHPSPPQRLPLLPGIARGSTDTLGAETNFAQVLANGDLLLPLPYGFSLIPRVQLGATWQRNPVTDLPPTLRFYAGGDRSVRGYTYQSLGPKDASGNVIGGKNLLVGSLELEYALAKNWAIAAFYDVGNAFNNTNNLRLAQGAGIGIRYYTLAGPIRIDVARQINVDDPGFQLHISLGFAL